MLFYIEIMITFVCYTLSSYFYHGSITLVQTTKATLKR